MRTFIYTYLLLLSFLISYLLVPVSKKVAQKFNLYDFPGERKIHLTSKPLTGGVAILFSFLLVVLGNIGALFIFRDFQFITSNFPFLPAQIPHLKLVLPKLSAILISGILIAAVGLLDDLKGPKFSAAKKLAVQFIVALFLVLMGVKTSYFPGAWLNGIITVIWIVGIINAFNLLDNMDGLSAGVAIISAAIFFVTTATQGQFFSAMILITLVGSLLGFLRYNFHPSSIFMGDSGSLFIGLMLGSLTVTSSYVTEESPSLLPVIMPVIILSIPIFDTISVIFIRIKERRPIYVGDKRHFSHRLVNLGMGEREAVLFIYLVTLVIGLSALLLPKLSVWQSLVIVFQAALILSVVSILMVAGKRGRGNTQ
ncbi:MAG: MraY family glycosyltransferase [Fidelibacterota bacterium]